MAKELKFDVYHPGEMGAGIWGYSDAVTVTVENDPGGEEGEFGEYMRECLAEWFDGAKVTPNVKLGGVPPGLTFKENTMDTVAKLRHMGRQYANGQAARGGGQQKHYLEEAADEIDTLRAENVELRAQQIEYIGKSAKQQDEIERLNEIMADARCDHFGTGDSMEQTVKIPTRLALLIARYLAAKADVARSFGYKREADMVDVWKNDLIDVVTDQCTTEEFEAAAVAVKFEEGTY